MRGMVAWGGVGGVKGGAVLGAGWLYGDRGRRGGSTSTKRVQCTILVQGTILACNILKFFILRGTPQ